MEEENTHQSFSAKNIMGFLKYHMADRTHKYPEIDEDWETAFPNLKSTNSSPESVLEFLVNMGIVLDVCVNHQKPEWISLIKTIQQAIEENNQQALEALLFPLNGLLTTDATTTIFQRSIVTHERFRKRAKEVLYKIPKVA